VEKYDFLTQDENAIEKEISAESFVTVERFSIAENVDD
jgi:hypothetical protein